MTKIWVTKYALSSGIFEVEAEVSENHASYKRGESKFSEYTHGNDFYLSYDDAALRARDMRDAKIKSLQKQIAKLEKLAWPLRGEASLRAMRDGR